MGAMSMDLKPPLSGGLGGPLDPAPPPPTSGNAKKKRRTSSAANAQPAPQPQPPQVQDLLPPPLSGKTAMFLSICFSVNSQIGALKNSLPGFLIF